MTTLSTITDWTGSLPMTLVGAEPTLVEDPDLGPVLALSESRYESESNPQTLIDLYNGDSFHLEFVIRAPTPLAGVQSIIYLGIPNTAEVAVGLKVVVTVSGGLQIWTRTPTNPINSINVVSLVTGTVYHVSLGFTRSGGNWAVSRWVNGVQASDQNLLLGALGTETKLGFGQRLRTPGGNPSQYVGILGPVRFCSRALTNEEVTAGYTLWQTHKRFAHQDPLAVGTWQLALSTPAQAYVSMTGPSGEEITERVPFSPTGVAGDWTFNRRFLRFAASESYRFARGGALWESLDAEVPLRTFSLEVPERPVPPRFEPEFEPGGLSIHTGDGGVVTSTTASHTLYAHTLAQLLPPNPLREAPNLQPVLRAMSREYARVQYAAKLLLREAVPSTAAEFLHDYERLFGVPSDLYPSGDTLEERRNAVLDAKTEDRTGLTSTIEEILETAGFTGIVVERNLANPFTCESTCEDFVQDTQWAYTLRITTNEEVEAYAPVRAQVEALLMIPALVEWVTA